MHRSGRAHRHVHKSPLRFLLAAAATGMATLGAATPDPAMHPSRAGRAFVEVQREIVSTAHIPAPSDDPRSLVPQPGDRLRLDARSAHTIEIEPKAGSVVVVALDGGGIDVDLVATGPEGPLAAAVGESSTAIVVFRAPGGRVLIDVLNATDTAAAYEWWLSTTTPARSGVSPSIARTHD